MARPRPNPPARADRGLVALLTDFGTAGHHAGLLHGVVLGLNPAARLVDLSHGIPAGDVALGAWTLRWSWRWFPAGTVLCAVVDPGVGTARRALAAAAGGRFFVGPDNGLLSYALADAGDAAVVTLPAPDPQTLSATFHGRDLFAPAAARLSLGLPLARLGRPAGDWVRLAEQAARRVAAGRLAGEVIAVDRWGNLVTSLTAADLAREGLGGRCTVRVGRSAIRGIRGSYAEARPGGRLALINSSGHLEVAVNGGRADETLGAGRGTTVRVEDDTRR